MQQLHNHMCWGFPPRPGETGWDSSRNPPMDTDPTWVCEGAPPAACPHPSCAPDATCLLEVLRVVLGGHEDDRLVLGLHHAAQQVEQHGWFVVPADVEESQLQGEGRAQPFWVPTLLGTPRNTRCRRPGWLLTPASSPRAQSPAQAHLELLAELGLHIQTDQRRLGETCGTRSRRGCGWHVGHAARTAPSTQPGAPAWPSLSPAWFFQSQPCGQHS